MGSRRQGSGYGGWLLLAAVGAGVWWEITAGRRAAAAPSSAAGAWVYPDSVPTASSAQLVELAQYRQATVGGAGAEYAGGHDAGVAAFAGGFTPAGGASTASMTGATVG